MEPYVLDKKRDAPLMLAAFRENKLQAQNANFIGFCTYRSTEGPCVIGAVLPDSVALEISGSVDYLSRSNVLKFKQDSDAGWFKRVQKLHDSAAYAHQLVRLEKSR